jgi:CubicO group peptidase (beta-lactamase class C family)
MANDAPEGNLVKDRDVQAAVQYAKAYLECMREDRHIPGLSAAFVYEGDVIWSGGFGYADAESKRAADADTIFPQASITKVVTCTMMMQLRDAGELCLDDPLEKHLPGFGARNPFPEERPATLRQIASHTSGLQRETPTDAWETLVFPGIDEILERLPDCEFITPPLTEHKYSNLAFALLGHALSLVAGQPYDEYVEEHILTPLGMDSSGYTRQGAPAERLATCYPWAEDEDYGKPCPEYQVGAFKPVGGLFSTVNDLARFAALHLGHARPGAESVLGQATAKEMRTVQWLNPDWQSGQGIGWGIAKIAGRYAVGHSGGLPGLSTDLRLLPELGLGSAVFMNVANDAAELNREVLSILAPAVSRAQARRKPKESKEAPQEWSIYLGRYQSAVGKAEVEVMLVDAKLMVRSVNQPLTSAIVLKPKAEHVFTMEGGSSKGEPAVFEVDEEGNVTKVRMGGYPFLRK